MTSQARAATPAGGVSGLRVLIAGVGVAFFLLIGGLMSIPFIIGKPLAVVRPSGPTTWLTDTADGGMSAGLRTDQTGGFVLDLAFSTADEEPRIEVRMPEHGMVLPARRVRVLAPGRFQLDGRFAMPGRWKIDVDYAGVVRVLQFIVSES